MLTYNHAWLALAFTLAGATAACSGDSNSTPATGKGGKPSTGGSIARALAGNGGVANQGTTSGGSGNVANGAAAHPEAGTGGTPAAGGSGTNPAAAGEQAMGGAPVIAGSGGRSSAGSAGNASIGGKFGSGGAGAQGSTAGGPGSAGKSGAGAAGKAGAGSAGKAGAGPVAGAAGTGGVGAQAPAGQILYQNFTGWGSFGIGTCPGIKSDRHPPLKAIQKLATTNQEVRILVYGQSLSMGTWVDGLRSWLQQQYPGGNLKLESHARAGCTARCLVGGSTWDDPVHWTGMGVDPDPNPAGPRNRLPKDVFSWKPDLVIFHVLTDYKEDYTLILQGLTAGCSAFQSDSRSTVHCQAGVDDAGYLTPEVIVQTDPRTTVNAYPVADAWHTDINEVFVPGQVATAGYFLADNWADWKGFLDKTGVPRTDLEASPGEIHFSDNGHKLMTKSTAQHLCYP